MGLLSWLRTGSFFPEFSAETANFVFPTLDQEPAPEVYGISVLPIYDSTRVTRSEALQVPAVLRARNLICGTLGTLPLHLHDRARNDITNALFEQPEVALPRSVTMTMLFEDLLFEGESWWRITEFAWTNYPKHVERIEHNRVTVDTDGRVWIDGKKVSDAELIRFQSPNPGLLSAASRAIRTCLKLDAAAARYADEPMPQGMFTPAEGADPAEDEDITALLTAWKTARKTGSTAYVPAALKYHPVQWSPEDLQLADARQHAVLEIARACGVDPEDLGVSTTSRTYQNAEQRRLDLLDFTLGAYVSAVQDRLSMGDVTPNGYYARFKFDGFLRSDTLTRYTAYEKGLAVGALGKDEIRALEDKPNLTPTQEAAPVQSQPQQQEVQQ
jgi:phage portal protein BeeE